MGITLSKAFVASVLIILGVGAAWYSNQPSNAPNIANTSTTSQEENNTNTTLSDNKDGITVEVSDIKVENGKTIAMLIMDNHAYNLSDMDVVKFSSFGDVKPSDYEIKKTQMGGHHVESEMIFDGEPSGDLIVGLNEDLIFNFGIE